MKRFGLLATIVVLSAIFSTFYSDRSAAMPITIAFEATVTEPMRAGDERVYVSGGGIFAPGQTITGSIRYDPGSFISTFDTGSGLAHLGVIRGASYSISAVGGHTRRRFQTMNVLLGSLLRVRGRLQGATRWEARTYMLS